MKVAILFVALLVALVAANAHSANGWKPVGRTHGHNMHRVIIAVKGGADALGSCDSELMRVSTPGSPDFGKHMTAEEVRALLADEANVATVENWLRHGGVAFRTSPRGDFIEIHDRIEKLEKLFDVHFHSHSHPLSKVYGARANKAPRIPARVSQAIDVIANVDDALPDLAKRQLSRPQFQPGANGQVTPAFLNQYYGYTGRADGTSAGVYEALGQDFAESDLNQFMSMFNLQAQKVNITGPNQPSNCQFNLNACAEFTLDVEYLQGLSQGAKSAAYIVPQTVQDIFVYWSNWVSQGQGVDVWSISYGGAAEDEAPTDKQRFALDTCKAGLMGVTTFVASGDDGVQGAQNCLSNTCQFAPSFPATVPYVTAVGATNGPENGQEEVVCSTTNNGVITSGSSSSNYFNTPTWQQSAVTAYLNSGVQLPASNMFNRNGRFVPDVSFLGAQYVTVIGGRSVALFGTSAASPSFAAGITLINAARRAAGKSALGFINPALYSAPASAFNDITKGNTGCCSTSRGGCECGNNGDGFGFQATTGWDAASGFGTPRFAALKSYLMSL